MATPGTADYPKKRHNLHIGDHAWSAITRRAAELGIPAGEVIDRAIALVTNLEEIRAYDPNEHESPNVLLLDARLEAEAEAEA